jgi:S-adenosylmethionine:tRNA ribosyltransferase-isomerase
MNLKDFTYHLPAELIGQKAIEPRDSCKLMVVNRENNQIFHHVFRDLVNILDSNTVLVLNDTKVFPARLFGTKDSGGKTEILLLKQLSPNSFSCLVRGKSKESQKIIFSSTLYATLRHCESRNRAVAIQIEFNLSGPDLLTQLDIQGKTPLPPYIHSEESEMDLREQYQTVYAKEKGSAAAPTAGLHFTEELLESLQNNGVQIEKITLHVGLGTFKPVTQEQIESKTLHSEQFEISEETAERINEAKKQGKKIIAVGTTSCRVLESQTDEQGFLKSGRGETNIFIQPPYQFKLLNGLITNFHFPETSLLMLVSALVSFPNSPIHFENFSTSLVGEAYAEAVKNKYKFFSFGDAMIIL